MTLSCPFCALPETRILRREAHALVVPDAHPVSPGHTLIVPVRHVASALVLPSDAAADDKGDVQT